MIEDAGQDAPASWKSLPGLAGMRSEPVLDAVRDAAASRDLQTTPRLAVCPYCRTVWELESIFPEPVKLMICWRCAAEHASAGASASPAARHLDSSGRPPLWWKVAGYGALVALGLAVGYVASHLWFEEATSARTATGLVSVMPGRTEEAAGKETPQTTAPAVEEAVVAPPAAGPIPAAAPVAQQAETVPPSEAAQPQAPARRERTTTGARRSVTPPAPPATAPPREFACTSAVAALGLCSAGTTDGRP